MSAKEIKLNVSYEPYYGISVNVWGVEENGDSRYEFLEKMYECMKEEWICKNVDVPDWIDFIHTLNNDLNGEELFKNVINNFLYIEYLEKKAYNLGISLNFIHVNNHPYADSEQISIFNKITPLLKNTKDFENWFLYELKLKDKKIYCILFNDEESKKSLINKIKYDIENKEKTKKYHENEIKNINAEIKEYKKHLKDL